MLRPFTSFCIWVSLGIFFTLACLAECEGCPSEGVCKPVDCSACYSFFGFDHGYGCTKNVHGSEEVVCVSEAFSFLSTVYDSDAKKQCSRRENPNINATWSSDDFTSQLIDGGALSCFVNVECPGCEAFLPCVNNTDQIVLFPGQGYLLTTEAGFISQNIEIEQLPSSEVSSSPCLSINPEKLDFGENYIYYPSVAFLKLKNVCDTIVIMIYEPFTTNSQFYPFNYTDTVLGPGEVTSISFVFFPKSLGVYSAELVLQTSLGGFLVHANGSGINSPHRLLPVVVMDVTEVTKSKKLLKIVTYNASDVKYDTFVGICLRRRLDLLLHLACTADRSYKTETLRSTQSTSVLTKEVGNTEVGEFALEKRNHQSTVSSIFVLEDHELLFPLVPLDRQFTKSITIKNPSQQPVMVQLVLNSDETVNNCKLHNHITSPQPSNLIQYDSASSSRYGFSTTEDTVTEAFLHPYGVASLGPIIFHPSNRCEWKSSALIRSNLSGVEQLSLRGFGGLFSFVVVEGAEHKHKLDFNMNLPSLNASVHMTYSLEETRSRCLKPLSKKLVALNAGDFDVNVERIGVSGVACGLDGFLVHNCRGFSLAPGESLDLEVSFQTDFSAPMVKRDLEFKLSTGMLVLPMQASVSFDMLSLCRKSIFWVRVKKCCIALVLSAVLMFLLFWLIILQMEPSNSVDYVVKVNTRHVPVGKPKDNGRSVKVTKMGRPKPAQRDENLKQLPDLSLSPSLKSTSVEIERTDKEASTASLTVRTRKDKRRRPRKKSGPTATSGLMAHLDVSSSQSGNSTPSSPMSPITTSSPKNACSPSLGNKCLDVKANIFKAETVAPATALQNGGENLFYTQQKPFCPNFNASRPTLSSSATFPGTGKLSVLGPPSRLALSPDARAPGPRTKAQKSVHAEETTKPESRFVYDIWGNHLSGIHLMDRSEGSFEMMSEFVKGHSGSFFVKDPYQILLTNSAPAPVTVSRSSDDG